MSFQRPNREDYEWKPDVRKPLARKTRLKASRSPKVKSKRPSVGKRNKKQNVTKLKQKLWILCRELTRKVYGFSCYTCGAHSDAIHTGHFISSSVCSVSLRYDLRNLRPQCFRCNIHLSGNWLAYEKRLILEHGQSYVDNLKTENERSKGLMFDSLWYEAKIVEYSQMLEKLLTPS